MNFRITWVVALCCWLPVSSSAQEELKPRPSPLSVVTALYKDAYLKIVYSQPQKRGRQLFGNMVPYGQVWRTGANEATEITLTRDVSVNGNALKAGTYALFSIPEKDHWTLIFNSELGQWGSYNYNSKMDVLRIDVPTQTTGNLVYEPFTIAVDQKNDKADVSLMWDKTKVTFQLQFNEPKNP